MSINDLELISGDYSKSQRMSLLVILAVLMFLLTEFEYVIPVPLGMAALFIFKDFKELAAKALVMSNGLGFIFVMLFLNVLTFIFFLCGLVADYVYSSIYINRKFVFDKTTILYMSSISSIPMTLFILPTLNQLPYSIEILSELGPSFIILSSILIIIIVYLTIGLTQILQFKLLKSILYKIFNTDEIRLA